MEWPEITKDTPMEELKRIHQQIWDYAIVFGYKPKTPYKSNCVACHWKSVHKKTCRHCPIIWPGKFIPYLCIFSLYGEWTTATEDKKVELAKQIHDLPWKFERENS